MTFRTPNPIIEDSNSEKLPYLGPNTVFCLGNVAKISDHFFGAVPHPKSTPGSCQKEGVLFGEF
jgi:hypothetical protein